MPGLRLSVSPDAARSLMGCRRVIERVGGVRIRDRRMSSSISRSDVDVEQSGGRDGQAAWPETSPPCIHREKNRQGHRRMRDDGHGNQSLIGRSYWDGIWQRAPAAVHSDLDAPGLKNYVNR